MCHWPGCTSAAEGYYCDRHKTAAQKRKEASRSLFKGTRRKRSAEYNRLYHTVRWRKLRYAFLKAHPVCAVCGGLATTVDHIIPHRGDEALFYDEGNLQALCASCHSAKTLKENGYFRPFARSHENGRGDMKNG